MVRSARTQVRQREWFQAEDEGQNKSFPIEAQGDGPLVVTLAWMDKEGSPNVLPVLQNDLDLLLVAPDGTGIWGNGNYTGLPDRLNNIERVCAFFFLVSLGLEEGCAWYAWLAVAFSSSVSLCCTVLQTVVDNPQPGTYTAHVIARELVDDQSFALVVSVVAAHNHWPLPHY